MAPRITILMAALALTVPVDLSAQQDGRIAPGDRVRIAAPGLKGDRLTGSVLRLGSDSVVLAIKNRAEPLSLPFAGLTQFEVSSGKKSRFGLGLGIGLFAGTITGLAVGAYIGSEMDCGITQFCYPPGTVALLGGLAGGAAGALIGGIIGALSVSERWEEVPLDRLHIGPSPVSADGVAASLTLPM